MTTVDCDTAVIGSGYGGALVADRLVASGERVVMIERGRWVERGPENWRPDATLELSPFYVRDTASRDGEGGPVPVVNCVGGASVFAGGVAMRFREWDFRPDADVVGDSGASWPLTYAELERHYGEAERLLGVVGDPAGDPTDPWRSTRCARRPLPLAPPSARLAAAAKELGLRPFRLPLAIDHSPRIGGGCRECGTCDTYACAISAKNDVATAVIAPLLHRGLRLLSATAAVRLAVDGASVMAAECRRENGERLTVRARRFVLSAGALGSAQLLLASDLARLNPGGRVVGRHLMRHCNSVLMGIFPRAVADEPRFHKQLGIHDMYGGESGRGARGGGLQQLQTPPPQLVRDGLPRFLGFLTDAIVDRATGLLAIAEDEPRSENRVALDHGRTDAFGLPRVRVHHRYTERDMAARESLARLGTRILRRAGALYVYRHDIETFSHAAGTVRMGHDPRTSALDRDCRYRGLDNLHVVDASFMPTCAAVNPSLTIAANALRVGERLAAGAGSPALAIAALA